MSQQLSVVIPGANNIARSYERIVASLEGDEDRECELIFSVDQSSSRTEDMVFALRDAQRVRMPRFLRRFGQPMATLAGLKYSSGDAVIVIDCDLWHPPDLIPALIERWADGLDVVDAAPHTRPRNGAQADPRSDRLSRDLRTAQVEIPPNTATSAGSAALVDNVVALKNGHGFLGGRVSSRQAIVAHDHHPKAGGARKYRQTLGSVRIAAQRVIGFSRKPSRLISIMAIASGSVAFLLANVYGALKLVGNAYRLEIRRS